MDGGEQNGPSRSLCGSIHCRSKEYFAMMCTCPNVLFVSNNLRFETHTSGIACGTTFAYHLCMGAGYIPALRQSAADASAANDYLGQGTNDTRLRTLGNTKGKNSLLPTFFRYCSSTCNLSASSPSPDISHACFSRNALPLPQTAAVSLVNCRSHSRQQQQQ